VCKIVLMNISGALLDREILHVSIALYCTLVGPSFELALYNPNVWSYCSDMFALLTANTRQAGAKKWADKLVIGNCLMQLSANWNTLNCTTGKSYLLLKHGHVGNHHYYSTRFENVERNLASSPFKRSYNYNTKVIGFFQEVHIRSISHEFHQAGNI